jgi:hypothetical protein
VSVIDVEPINSLARRRHPSHHNLFVKDLNDTLAPARDACICIVIWISQSIKLHIGNAAGLLAR